MYALEIFYFVLGNQKPLRKKVYETVKTNVSRKSRERSLTWQRSSLGFAERQAKKVCRIEELKLRRKGSCSTFLYQLQEESDICNSHIVKLNIRCIVYGLRIVSLNQSERTIEISLALLSRKLRGQNRHSIQYSVFISPSIFIVQPQIFYR